MVTSLLHKEEPAIRGTTLNKDEDRVRDQCRAWNRAVVAHDLDGLRELLSDRCVLIPPNGDSIRGQENVVEAWERIFSLPGLNVVFDPDRINLYPTGDVAHDIGRYRIAFHADHDGQRSTQDHGNHLLVWEKSGGHWRVRSNVFYSRGLEALRILA